MSDSFDIPKVLFRLRCEGKLKDERRAAAVLCVALALYPEATQDCVRRLAAGETVERRMSYVEGATERLLSYLEPFGISAEMERLP
jgi:hypothetical protein